MLRMSVFLSTFAVLMAAGTARAELIVGLASGTSANQLVRFDSATPGAVSGPVTISGLIGGGGENVVGIDYRPSDGALVAVTRQNSGQDVGRGRVYTVDALTGAATLINGVNGLRDAANNEVLLSEANFFSYGVDFNPAANALRIVNSNDQNLRITLGGTGVTNVDTLLNGPGTGDNPDVNAIAYSNNVAGATSTTLYALNRVPTPPGTRLQTIGGLNGTPSPNTGQLFDIAPLTPPAANAFTNTLGFDISGATGIAYASLRMSPPNDTPGIYTINLATGSLSLLGTYGGPGLLYDIAVVAVPEPGTFTLMAIGMAGLVGFVAKARKGRQRGSA